MLAAITIDISSITVRTSVDGEHLAMWRRHQADLGHITWPLGAGFLVCKMGEILQVLKNLVSFSIISL